MNKKVTVTILEHNFTLVTSEEEVYVNRVANLVDSELREISADSRLARADAATLTAINIADKLLKSQNDCENLRYQLKNAVEESAKTKLELAELKRELFKYQNRR